MPQLKLEFYKKSQDMNLLFVCVMGLVIAIVIVAGYKVVKQLNTAVKNMDIATQEVKDVMQTTENRYVSVFDMIFLFIFVMIWVVLIASAFFIDTHPVFFIISLLMTVVTAFVGGHIANAYSGFADDPNISVEASSFTIIPYIFQHYIMIIIIMGMTVTTVLFAKIRSTT